jgi:hypothetical protein
MAEEDSGAVVVVVRVGREGEDEPVDFGGGDANGETGRIRGAREVHDTGRDVAVKVEV